MSDEEIWGIRSSGLCNGTLLLQEKRVADVHTLAQIMNWGQKCKKASHTASVESKNLASSVKMHSFMSRRSLKLSSTMTMQQQQDGLVEWEQGNWAEAYVSWRPFKNDRFLGVGLSGTQREKLSVECQLEASRSHNATGDSFEASRRHVATLQGRSNGVERQILLCWTQQAADKENGQLLSELHGAVAKNLSQALAFSCLFTQSTSLLYSVEPRSVDLAVLLPRQNVFERITKVAFIYCRLNFRQKISPGSIPNSKMIGNVTAASEHLYQVSTLVAGDPPLEPPQNLDGKLHRTTWAETPKLTLLGNKLFEVDVRLQKSC